MILLVGIALITFLLTFSQSFIKLISLGSFFSMYQEDPMVLEEIRTAKQELIDVGKSDLGDYAKMVRKMRAENKINTLCKKLKADRDTKKLKGAFIDLVLGYGTQALLLISLFIISIKYRYTPVVVFDENFNFSPFSGIVTFPTGISNAISVPFWVFSCNITFRWVAGVIKNK